MAKAARKKVTIQYRQLADLSGGLGGHSLQSALAAAMQAPVHNQGSGARGDHVAERIADFDSYGTLVLNHHEAPEEFFFGEIVRFEPGADLPLLELGGAKSFNLSQAKAPEGHEPLKGVLYFMVFNNHVMLLENDCASSRAEKYLTWLLVDSGVVRPEMQVILDAELQSAEEGLQLSNVNQVVIKPAPVEPATPRVQNLEVDGIGFTGRDVGQARALDVLKAAGMAETDINAITEHDTKIEVTVQVRFKTKTRKRAVMMEDAKRLLRNVTEDEMTLFGTGGRQKNGRIVKLSHGANVLLRGSLLELQDTARALTEAYEYFIGNGYIDK